jgi:hypothetical protein
MSLSGFQLWLLGGQLEDVTGLITTCFVSAAGILTVLLQ